MIDRRTLGTLAAATLLTTLSTGAAFAQDSVTLKAAKTGTSYYQMAVQLSEAIGPATDGGISITVEESQGSVQNVKEAPARGAGYVFTSPPSLIGSAKGNAGPFEDDAAGAYADVRALFPIPSLTMHFVVSEESGVTDFAGLAGKTLILGKGSFGAREGAKTIETLGIADVTTQDVELSGAVSALRNGQVDGFVTAGSFPAPNVLEAAAGTGVTLLSMSDADVEALGRTRLVIPAGTYPGVDTDTVTTSLPVGAYTTAATSDDTAYAITKAFWESKAAMAETNPWWNGVDTDLVATLAGPVHPGAARYYDEVGVSIPE